MSLPPGTEVLDAEACWAMLHDADVGRLAVDNGGRPDIFPINFVIDNQSIVFRTGPGTKLAASALLHHVAFEIDGYEPENRVAWSVVVKGRANQIERMQDVYDADDLPLFPWVASDKPDFVRITADEVTGRRFHVVDEITPDASIGWTGVEDPTDPLAVLPGPGEEHHEGAPYLRPD
jgi:nitroimidazol reductase NimA-like FMN-containing flavoprotein (pyridoxamine 5'-phosphate oxidase superfamily)